MTERVAGAARRGEHATFRELKAAEEALVRRMSAIEMEQASQRAALQHVPEDLRQLTSAVNGLAARMPEKPAMQVDHMALALQRLAETMEKQQRQPSMAAELAQVLRSQPASSGGKTWGLVGALTVVAALFAWQLFIG